MVVLRGPGPGSPGPGQQTKGGDHLRIRCDHSGVAKTLAKKPLHMRKRATILRVTMRAILIAVVGGVATLGALGVGVASNGPIGDASVILAIFLATVTIGITLAVAAERFGDRPGKSRPGSCSVCRTSMHQIDTIWVCPACDLAPAVH